jgi:chromosome partitioning protein
VLARKGGAGKSTLTLHWAVEAERQGKGQVAVIDMDPQQTSVKWSKRRLQQLGKHTPAMLVASAGELQQALAACEASGMTLVLIDTPPHVEAPCREAARLADLVVIPCGPTAPDLEAIGATIHVLAETDTAGVIVLNQGRPGSSINQKAISVLTHYGLPVCPGPVMRRAALADAFTDGRAVVELEPEGKAAAEITRSWRWIVQQCT